MPPEEIRARVEARVAECVALAKARFPTFPAPRIEWYSSRAAAGMAHYREWMVSFNQVLMEQNLEDMLRETVAHEVAHMVVFHLWDVARLTGRPVRRPPPHGRVWQDVMRNLMGVEPRRTHNYCMDDVPLRVTRRYTARCACREHKITAVRFNRMRAGKANYRCKLCSTALTVA